MLPRQDLKFEENDSLEIKVLKSQLFFIHNLVCLATAKDLGKRIESVDLFRKKLNAIKSIDENIIQALEADDNFDDIVDNDAENLNSERKGFLKKISGHIVIILFPLFWGW